MKKSFLIIIISYITIAALVLIFFSKDQANDISIMSVKKDYSRVITKNETIDLPMYISQESTFFTGKDNIIDARILSDVDEIKIDIINIKNQKQKITYDSETYFFYYIEIGFSNVYSENMILNMVSAYLQLTYLNEEILKLDLGNVSLMFNDLNQTSHIDFNRMYSIHDQDAIIGIYIELVNKTNQSITIHSIDCLNNDININLNHINIAYDEPNYQTEPNTLFNNYDVIKDEFEENSPYLLTNNTHIILPVQHLTEYNYINRFPLIIHYEYNQEMYTFIIDDYLFFNHLSDLYNDYYDIEKYQYNYQ